MSSRALPAILGAVVLLAAGCGNSHTSTTIITTQVSEPPSSSAPSSTAGGSQKHALGAYLAAMAPVQREMGTADLVSHQALDGMDEAHDGTWRVARDRLFRALAANQTALKTAKATTPPDGGLAGQHQQEVFALGAQNRAINALLFAVRSNALEVLAFQAGLHIPLVLDGALPELAAVLGRRLLGESKLASSLP
jgi:hypothetical protein